MKRNLSLNEFGAFASEVANARLHLNKILIQLREIYGCELQSVPEAESAWGQAYAGVGDIERWLDSNVVSTRAC